MALAAIGVNHQSAPLAVRERLALSPDLVPETLQKLRRFAGVDGAMLLSTCNRTEIYLQGEMPANEVLDWYLRQCGTSAQMAQHFYQRKGADAVRHVFRVASGLDSQILGEPQILGQLKTAYTQAKACAALSTNLDRMVQQSFMVAKDVRTNTGLGAHAVSVASASMKLIKQMYDQLERRHVLVLGAGETAELLCRHLLASGVRQISVLNRTPERAQRLAATLNDGALAGLGPGNVPVSVQAGSLAHIGTHLLSADIVLSATAAHTPVLDLTVLQQALKTRKRRTLLLIDLGVPRDIAPGCAQLPDCYLYSVDDLKDLADEGMAARVQAAQAAEIQVEAEVAQFMRWLDVRKNIAPILALRQSAHEKRDQHLQLALSALHAGATPEEVMEKLAHQLTNSWLHTPTMVLKTATENQDTELLEAARTIFRLSH
jgi:glutamyl-tRNA reductase